MARDGCRLREINTHFPKKCFKVEFPIFGILDPSPISNSFLGSGSLSGYDLVAKNAGRLRIAARAVDVVDVEERCRHPIGRNGATIIIEWGKIMGINEYNYGEHMGNIWETDGNNWEYNYRKIMGIYRNP